MLANLENSVVVTGLEKVRFLIPTPKMAMSKNVQPTAQLHSSHTLSDFTFTFHFHALEKDMATHSSVLAWRIPGQGSLVGCRLWGRTELDTTEET